MIEAEFSPPHPDCRPCGEYLARRVETLPPAVVHYARKRRMRPTVLLVEFARGLHARHEAGLHITPGVD